MHHRTNICITSRKSLTPPVNAATCGKKQSTTFSSSAPSYARQCHKLQEEIGSRASQLKNLQNDQKYIKLLSHFKPADWNSFRRRHLTQRRRRLNTTPFPYRL
ncbi:hypothetical protein AZE42_12961 [Rhizopogon vesiculosus]|uniref:Uncharacterized protein n=1 Tax=Rhizopogon vesiculosus TaxID=180088 RepID=A0A1J8QKT7_9AGAM|nr:hypothetical protein AZE42_12961 [Rhizopogon vesiculosus]